MRVAYVLKQYPRFSETFIVNEILAHEAAGLSLEIYSLRPAVDGLFQDGLARVRAQVRYLPSDAKMSEFWETCEQARQSLPGYAPGCDLARGADARDVYQALLVALDARARGVDHLHAHFGTLATTVARLAGQFAELPYSFTAHAKDIYHEGVSVEELRQKLRDAAGVVTVSDYNLHYLQELYGDAAAGVRRVYNGLDLRRFNYCEPIERRPVIAAVGRLVEKKGFADLIAACGILVARGIEFRCQIIGGGELEQCLKRQAAEGGLDRVIEFTGPLPQSEVAPRIQQAAVMAAPCIIGGDGNRDGLPTVLLEAMALGTPCVATDVTGIPELVRHGQTGLLTPQRDPQQLAAALERLLEQPQLRVQLARGARALIEAEFDIENSAAAVRQVFAAARPAPRLMQFEEALSCA